MKKIFILIVALLLVSCSVKDTQDVKIVNVSPVPELGSSKVSDRHLKNNETASVSGEYIPLNYDEQKSIWLSYIDLAPMLSGKNRNEFENAFSEACNNIKNIGCNTLYVHVRSFGDAYYISDYFPWSKGITGAVGNEPSFDPLEIMVNIAHNKGLSFHAWINPLRCETESNMKQYPESCILKKWFSDSGNYGEYLVKVDNDDHYWLNPAVDEVRELICCGVEELCENYKIDGIHIDDYFYPTTESYFDSETYIQAGASMTLSDWRLDNCSKMVKEIHDTIKKVNKNILFGVSPQGNIENNYSYMYADVKKWCSTDGYIDYIVPQIYFGYENTAKPFEKTAEEWNEIAESGNAKLVIGLAPYKISDDSEFTDNIGIIASQIKTSEKLKCYSGIALYNYINIFCTQDSLSERLDKEITEITKALAE